jgi:ATP adenylyltransferase
VRAERWWRRAVEVSEQALAAGALVPLETRLIDQPAIAPFLLRELVSRPPRHLRPEGPKPNPFLPWDQPLEVGHIGESHVLLLNKYPVQACHLLVITRGWQPQSGWLDATDWASVAAVGADTGGLWFFNSGATAGASQPHRHLQLLPRSEGAPSCPLAFLLESQLQGASPPWPWAYRLSPRLDPIGGRDLEELYASHCEALGLGRREFDEAPLHPYNVLFDDRWFLTVRRWREHGAGFSVNGLGFAGYLLCTEASDRNWLERHGPWALLASVAVPA